MEKETASNNKKCVLQKKYLFLAVHATFSKECNISLWDTGKGGFDRIAFNCWYLYCLHFYSGFLII